MSDDATQQVIRTLAGSMRDLQQQAALQYLPVADDILRNASRDVWHIEHTLDRLLDFCGCGSVLEMYKRLCRHYWDIDPEAAAYYVSAYREYWDSELRRLRDRSLLDLRPHGANSYYTLPSALTTPTSRSPDQNHPVQPSSDRGEHDSDRGEQGSDRKELPPEILTAIGRLGTRPRKDKLRAIIEAICACRAWTTPAELAQWLGLRPDKLTERHLSPMIAEGRLERRFPDVPTHERQAYRSTRPQLPVGLSRESEQ